MQESNKLCLKLERNFSRNHSTSGLDLFLKPSHKCVGKSDTVKPAL